MDMRSDTVSPQAADIVDKGLGESKRQGEGPAEKSFTPGKQIHPNDHHLRKTDHIRPSENRFAEKGLPEKYKSYFQGHSSDLDSETDQDGLTPDSPRDGNKLELSQRLSSKINPYSLPFGPEESRLQFGLESAQFKERLNALGIDEHLRRRYSLQDSLQDASKLTNSSSSPPSSPPSRSLESSPQHSYQGQGSRSIHDLSFDEQDSNAFLPRVKEGLFFCHLCSFSGSTQEDFDQHMTVHFEHVCPHCDYKSRTEGRLKRHIKDFHSEDPDGGYNRTMPGRPKVFRCKQCDFSTADKVEFWTHSRSHIKEDKLLQCPRCPFVTEYKHHLEYHLRNHFGSKPFKCPKCNYACVNKSMLNSHMKSHTNVYQYRCADCTYATKYCHSLKLHLRKYNHKPAAVLNSDGSLPQGVDATASGLSLMAKRGPPRGPRGPRKDKLEPGSPGFMPMPPTSMGHLPGLPGMMSPFWPLMQSQMAGHMPHPLGLGPRFGPQLPGFPNFGIKTEDVKSPPPTSSDSSSNTFKCNLCTFVGTSREVLTSHVVKAHASENQDLFSMFGLSSESLLADSQKRFDVMNSFRSPLKSLKMDKFSTGLDSKKDFAEEMMKAREAEEALKMSPFSFMNGKYRSLGEGKDEGIDILKQMTLKFGSGPVDLKRKLPQDTLPVSTASSTSADVPLDLTKPRSSPSLEQPIAKYKTEDAEHSSGENSVCSNDVMSPTPRKRSRKGKAFKLDTLCWKLQEKQGSMYESDEDPALEVEEMYGSRFQPLTLGNKPQDVDEEEVKSATAEASVDGKMNGNGERKDEMENGHTSNEDESITEDTDMPERSCKETEKEVLQSEIQKIHSGLDMLNGQASSDVEKKAKEDNQGEVENGEAEEDEKNTEKSVSSPEEDFQMSPSPPGFLGQSQNKRKPVPAAVQRGADIAWKILNDPQKIGDPTQLLKGKNNGQKLELSPLDKKLWLDAPFCTNKQKTEQGEYECPHCQISFGDCIMYTMHMGYHGYKDPYKCNMCGDTCKDRVEFFLHIARTAHN